MGIKDEIKYFTEKFTVKLAKSRMDNLLKLMENLTKNVDKIYKDERKPIFTSQDIRSLLVTLEKVHKNLNKQITYTQSQNRIVEKSKITRGATLKETQNLHWKIFTNELQNMKQMARNAIDLQVVIAQLNKLACIMYVFEFIEEKEKVKKEKEDSYILEHAIWEALNEASYL